MSIIKQIYGTKYSKSSEDKSLAGLSTLKIGGRCLGTGLDKYFICTGEQIEKVSLV